MDDSDVLVENYTVNTNKVAKPVAAPPGGTVAADTSITLTTGTAGAGIRWTLDGSIPSASAGTVYESSNKPEINAAGVLRAIAYKAGMDDSDVLTAAYAIGTPGPVDPAALSFTIMGSPETPFTATNQINGIAWGGPGGEEKFVAVANGGQIAYSEDGENWTQANVGAIFSATNIAGVAWGGPDAGKKFVAVGRDGKAAYSTDGESWSNAGVSIDSSKQFTGIAWGGPEEGKKFVAVATGGQIAHSADGIAWTFVTGTNAGLNNQNAGGITWGGDKFVVAADTGRMAYSLDGATWTAIAPGTGSDQTQFADSQHIKAIAYGGPEGAEKFIAGGVEGIMVASTNGVTWTTVTTHGFASTDIFRAITWGAGRFVAAGGKQATPAEGDSRVTVSADGLTWETPWIESNTARNFYGAACGGGRFVLTADNAKLAYSNIVE
jgi:hypothetical protein